MCYIPLKSIKRNYPLSVLFEVGMTVTRSAMSPELLGDLDPHLVIVEEAAEVLESNLLGGLLVTAVHATRTQGALKAAH